MEYNEALSKIEQIHAQLILGKKCTGFRVVTTAATGAIVIAAAALQHFVFTNVSTQPVIFFSYWVGVAALCGILTGLDIYRRFQFSPPQKRQATVQMLRQFVPFILAAAFFSISIMLQAPQFYSILPAVWGLVFGLGIFSVQNLFAPSIKYSAFFYVGMSVVFAGMSQPAILAPAMAGIFGCGQFLVCEALRRTED